MESGGPRWKGKNSPDLANANPMSELIKQLQTSLTRLESRALLTDSDVLLEAGSELRGLLDRTCFGQPIVTAEKDNQWFRLSFEEAYYLCRSLKSLTIAGEDEKSKTEEELWEYMRTKRPAFPSMYKGYAHLRSKNWVVRSGTQYGVDFVAYRHHPALVHSEYAVLVIPEGGGGERSPRLTVWSDFQCTVRVCTSVAKTLLVLCINWNDSDTTSLPSCLDRCTVHERAITRWVPEQRREDKMLEQNGTNQEEKKLCIL